MFDVILLGNEVLRLFIVDDFVYMVIVLIGDCLCVVGMVEFVGWDKCFDLV